MSSRLIVEVGSRGSNSTSFEISYDLLDTPLAKLWRLMLSDALAEKREIANGGVFFGSRFYRREDLVSAMTDTIRRLEESFGPVFSSAAPPSTAMTHDDLNSLHSIFESLEKRTEYRSIVSKDPSIPQVAQRLNLAIHLFENLEAPSYSFHVDVDFLPTLRVPIPPEHFSDMTPDRDDGDLFVSYGTTGVPPLWAYINGGSPTFQTELSSDFQMHFHGPWRFTEWEAFDKWLGGFGMKRGPGLPSVGGIKVGHLASGISKRQILEGLAILTSLPKVRSLRLIEGTS